jgi:hypothetical protein
VHDTLTLAGSQVEIADAQKVRGRAPLTCKTDRIERGFSLSCRGVFWSRRCSPTVRCVRIGTGRLPAATRAQQLTAHRQPTPLHRECAVDSEYAQTPGARSALTTVAHRGFACGSRGAKSKGRAEEVMVVHWQPKSRASRQLTISFAVVMLVRASESRSLATFSSVSEVRRGLRRGV